MWLVKYRASLACVFGFTPTTIAIASIVLSTFGARRKRLEARGNVACYHPAILPRCESVGNSFGDRYKVVKLKEKSKRLLRNSKIEVLNHIFNLQLDENRAQIR
jgi:hypothetical protein